MKPAQKKPIKKQEQPTPQDSHVCPYFDYEKRACVYGGSTPCYLRKQTVDSVPCRYYDKKGQ